MNRNEAIKHHYSANWKATAQAYPFERGPFQNLPTGFRVLLFPPHEGRDMWTYATCGMSSESDTHPIELHLFSPRASNEIVELLYALAHFHHNEAQCDLWHTVNFGRPWLKSSECTFGLISLPYLDGLSLENLDHDNSTIKFYWLIPITKAELDFKKQFGIEALERKFEKADFNYSEPSRLSAV